MKTFINFLIVTLFLVCIPGLLPAAAVEGEQREWTRKDGQSVMGKLVDVDGDRIKVLIRGKVFDLNLQDLVQADREYVSQVSTSSPAVANALKEKPKPPVGSIVAYKAEFSDDEQKAFYEENGIKSLMWKGGRPEQKLPFVLYEPETEIQSIDKLPMIIHLVGTGGIGRDNTKTVFNDAGGIAKTFFSDSLQRKNPCYVMIPQPPKTGAWFAACFTTPSETLSWVVIALRKLLEDPSYRIDPDRIYITGLSMGGAGVYQAMAKFPGVFAAGIPISYVESHELFNKSNVSNMWVVLNSGDEGQPLEMLEDFEKHYRRMGGKIRTTVYRKHGHDAWKAMLGEQDFRVWLFSRKKGDSR